MSGRLTISLSALSQNYRTLSAQTPKQLAGVVKANAYGVGIEVVVPQLIAEGCGIFFVATSLEGQRVRELVNDELIYVLEGISQPEQKRQFLECDLRPIINNSHQMKLWGGAGEYALHIDTGMERLGFDFEEGLSHLQTLEREPKLLLSHFARADNTQDRFTEIQLSRIEQLRASGLPMSLSNSAGILLHEVAEDIARAGIALYGGSPSGAPSDCLQPVVRLEGQVLQIRSVRAGTPVGYGGAYVAEKDERIATIGVGYADGVSRLLSNQGQVWAGESLSIVGRVSMDMIHVRCDLVALQPGDYVEILGGNVNVEAVAQKAQTLSYEILTGLDAARRLERVTTEASL